MDQEGIAESVSRSFCFFSFSANTEGLDLKVLPRAAVSGLLTEDKALKAQDNLGSILNSSISVYFIFNIIFISGIHLNGISMTTPPIINYGE